MKAGLAAALMLAGFAAPVHAAGRVWTVAEIHRQAWQLNGKVIELRGWLPKCERLDCSLFGSKLDAEEFGRNPAGHPLLEIAPDATFDASVRERLPAQVLLRAKIDATCIDPKNRTDSRANQLITVCADRVHELNEVKLIEIQPAAGDAARARN
ncbi:MAG: hypothetical protein ACM3ZV_11560 [Bacillota bacterium]